jgi:hypothetical protein
MEVKNFKRNLSNYHLKDYHYTMDELDLFIEEFMALQQGTTKLTPLEARLLMGQVHISYDISRERKLPIETRYYGELLSRLIKSYGH